MKRIIFFVGLILLSVPAFSEPLPVVYLSREDMIKAMDGDSRLGYVPLGRVPFRQFYGDLPLSRQQKRVYEKMKLLLPNYPLAVVSRQKLIFKTDDNCTVSPDRMNGVDIGEACRNHDYCYRGLPTTQSEESDQNHYLACNAQLMADIQKSCHDVGRDCTFSEYYNFFVKVVSYPIYQHVKKSELRMIQELLSNLKKHPEDRPLFEKTDVFDFKMTEKKYNSFCAWVDKKKSQGRYVSSDESEICIR